MGNSGPHVAAVMLDQAVGVHDEHVTGFDQGRALHVDDVVERPQHRTGSLGEVDDLTGRGAA